MYIECKTLRNFKLLKQPAPKIAFKFFKFKFNIIQELLNL